MSTYDADARVGLNHGAITARIKRFQKEGVAAFQDRKIAGRPRKLTNAQFRELRFEVLESPEMSYGELRDLVWVRFRVRYSHASLKRLLKSQFGIVWTGSRKKLGEGLNLAELQVAIDHATNWRIKERLKALIELAEGAEAETVAHSNDVHLETLRKWVKRYQCSGTQGLRGKCPERDGRPPKISLEQRAILTEWIISEPEIGEAGLSARVEARFGVSYSHSYMRRLACAARTTTPNLGTL